MAASDVERKEIWEDTGCSCLARILGSTGGVLTSTGVTSFTRKIFDLSSAAPSSAVHSTTAVAPSTDDIHSLKTDSRWTKDPTGFNFTNTIPSTIFTSPNRRYRVEYTFVPASTGDPDFKVVYELLTKSARGS